MNTGRTVFSQLLDFLPMHEFQKCVRRYGGDRRLRRFSCLDQFLSMVFAQLTYRESLRDIAICLRAVQAKLYHAGFRGRVSRSTLADANERRDWRLYADFAHVLIHRARRLYGREDLGLQLAQTVYVFDSTYIDLCLSLFPWAQFRRRKSAVKLHTLLDLRGNIPVVIRITGGHVADVNGLDALVLEAGAIYIFDRAYTDFRRLYRFTEALAFFVTRSKENLDFRRQASHRVDPATGVRSDQTILLQGPKTCKRYPVALRRIHYFDASSGKHFVFLTNNFSLPAWVIAQLYHCRWQIETFFKWIKQHLRIKSFLGTSPNAVKTQYLDCDHGLRAGCHRQKRTADRPQPIRNPPNSQYLHFRQSLYKTNTYNGTATKSHLSLS